MSLELDSERVLRFSPIQSVDAYRQFAMLLDLCFPVNEDCHFFDDFPVWNPRFEAKHIMRFGIFSGEQLICSCAVRYSVLKVLPFVAVPVSLVGAVATHPLWRGKGFASLLVDRALIWGQDHGAILALLWGSEHALYQRLGFELCGEQLRIPLSDLNLQVSSDSSHLDKVYQGWVPELFDLVRARQGGLLLNNEDHSWFEAHKNVEWFYSKNEGQVIAYAAYGRGIDLHGLVHEWGGNDKALKNIWSYIHEINPKAELLGPSSFFEDFQMQKKSKVREYLCMAKILDPRKFFSAIYPSLSVNFRPTNGKWELNSGNRHLGSLTQGQLAKQCFGPEQPLGSLGDVPLTSLWIWGLDAV